MTAGFAYDATLALLVIVRSDKISDAEQLKLIDCLDRLDSDAV